MNKNLEKLNTILELIRNSTVSTKDLQEFLIVMLETIKKSKQQFDDLSKENLETIAESIAYIKAESDKNLKTLDEESSKTLKKIESKLDTVSTLVAEVRAMKWEKPKDGKNGAPGTPGKDGSPDTGEDIVDKINALPVNEANQIDASHIKNLPEFKGSKGGSTARNLWQLQDYPLTTKGDILTYDTAAARLGVGEDGQVLVADSAEDTGMKWQDPSFLASITYMYSGTASGVGSYYEMPALGTWVEGAEANIVTAGVSTTPTLIASFITDAGSPGVTTLSQGMYHFHIETEKAAGANNYYVYAEVYKRTSGGTETLLVTSDNSTEVASNTRIAQDVDGFLSANEALDVTDRLVVKWYAVMLSSTATITTYFDNNTDARTELPASVVDASNFVRKSGDTMSGDLNMGGNSLVNTDFVGIGLSAPIEASTKLEIDADIVTGGNSDWKPVLNMYTDVSPATSQTGGATDYNLNSYGWLRAPASNTNNIAVLCGSGQDTELASSNVTAASVYGSYFNAYITGTGNTITAELGGFWAAANTPVGANTVPTMYGGWFGSSALGGTITDQYGAWFYNSVSGAANVTNAYGAKIDSLKSGAGTITNRYGIYLDTPTGTATNDYGIYQAGSQPSYMAGGFLDTGFSLKDEADPTKIAKFQCSGITTGTTNTYTLPNLSAATLATISSLSQTFSGSTTFSNNSVTICSGTGAATPNIGTGATVNGTTKTVSIGTNGVSGSTTVVNVGSGVAGANNTITLAGSSSAATTTIASYGAWSHTGALGNGTTGVFTTGTIELGAASDTTISRSSAGVIAVEGVVVPTVSSTDTLTNKTVTDSTFYIQDESDNTKKVQFQVSNITTGTTRTLTLPNADVVLAGISNAQTFTNKRITKRVGSTTSSATPTINTDNYDCYKLTALATAITSFTTNLSGTPTDFQELTIRIKDDGTARAITWGASFANYGAILPTTTTVSKVLTVKLIYDSVASKWGCVSAVEEL